MPTVHRFYLDTPISGPAGTVVALPNHVAHQAGTVLRLRAGDPLVLFDGCGGEWQAEVAALGRSSGEVRLVQFHGVDREPALRLTLCLALIKQDRFEWALQKGTELGVHAFQPLLTRRVVGAGGRGTPGQREREHALKTERWRRIVVEAAEQCERTVIPEVRAPRALRTVLQPGAATILCWEEVDGAEPAEPLSLVLARLVHAGTRVLHILVGPEGGFTEDEVTLARECGAAIASLGPRILRSETAAVAAASLALLGVA